MPDASVTAERAVLAAILHQPDAIGDVADVLTPDAFGVLDYRHIYAAMLACRKRGQRPDLIAVSEELTGAGREHLGVEAALVLAEPGGAPVYVNDYAARVRHHARRRAVLAAATSLVRALHDDPDADPGDLAHTALMGIADLTATDGGPQLYAEVIDAFQERLAMQVAGAWEERVTPTRLHALDTHLGGGFRPGELIILGARPGMGKTALAMQLMHNIARHKQPILMFSAEMSMPSMVERGMSEMTGIAMHELRRRQISQERFDALMRASERMAKMPVAIDDTSGITTAQMMTRAQRFQRQHGLGLIVFDYLELAGDQGTQGEQHRVSEIGRQLKHIARTVDVPFVALSQLSRNVENRTPPTPRMSDIRQSGAIEAAADIVILMYRHDYYVGQGQVAMEADKIGVADLYISKQRNGQNGKVSLRFDETSMRFTDLDEPTIIQRKAS